ncbi:MAG: hypothetical protein IJL67_11450 [Oscillospiraceae bacterium]|nr:hypothetical protein [Oscillospiraceae bacterium]
MKKNDLRDALSGIDRDYIAESDDFKAVSADFRKAKNRKIRVVSSVLCLVIVGAGLFGADKAGLFRKDPHSEQIYVYPDITTEISSESTMTNTDSAQSSETDGVISDTAGTQNITGSDGEISSVTAINEGDNTAVADGSQISSDKQDVTVAETSVTEEDRSGAPCVYSKLVKNTGLPDIEGYDSTAQPSLVAFDIDMFHEDITRNDSSVVEGEILDMWVNNYEYSYAFDKFEPDGVMNYKQSTVAYKIKVNRVLSGDFSAGDEITVEDVNYPIDRIVSVKKGSTYVIPIIKGDGVLYISGTLKSGSNVLESAYYTYYPFHPQIEKVDGGYVVPDDWKTLITDECTKIFMDIPEEEISYPASLYFVPDSVFNERMSILLNT